MIRHCLESDFQTIYEIINDAAKAYRGVIPRDSWLEPYMSTDALSLEIKNGIVFWGNEQDGELTGVMGIQDKIDVTLIRHAYVRTKVQNQGIGTNLLRHLEQITEKPILIGTWENATWAISFYQKHGYKLVDRAEKEILLQRYWSIPDLQIKTSVILANAKYIQGDVRPTI